VKGNVRIIKKRGNALGIWFFTLFFRIAGLNGAYFLLYFVAVYYLFFDIQALNFAATYLRKRFNNLSFFSLKFKSYLLFVQLGKQLIDRYVSLIKPDFFDFEIKGADSFSSMCSDSKGFILLTSHVGNWQIAMQGFKDIKKEVYLLKLGEENYSLKEKLKVDPVSSKIKTISPKQFLGGVVEVMNVLKKGAVVSIMGDRSYGADILDVEFLKGDAFFPYSAFHIAAVEKCKIIVLTCAKVSKRKYLLNIENVINVEYEGRKNKKEQLKKYLSKYSHILENFLEEYPYQCFIFDNIWKK